jgi:hypothetical protein
MVANLLQGLSLAGFAALAAFCVSVALRREEEDRRRGFWRAPALLSCLFLGLSLVAVAVEGPLGFWRRHVESLWGVQVLIDLLINAGVAFALLAPRARAVGMRPILWAPIVLATGGVGVLAMLARPMRLAQEKETAR